MKTILTTLTILALLASCSDEPERPQWDPEKLKVETIDQDKEWQQLIDMLGSHGTITDQVTLFYGLSKSMGTPNNSVFYRLKLDSSIDKAFYIRIYCDHDRISLYSTIIPGDSEETESLLAADGYSPTMYAYMILLDDDTTTIPDVPNNDENFINRQKFFDGDPLTKGCVDHLLSVLKRPNMIKTKTIRP